MGCVPTALPGAHRDVGTDDAAAALADAGSPQDAFLSPDASIDERDASPTLEDASVEAVDGGAVEVDASGPDASGSDAGPGCATARVALGAAPSSTADAVATVWTGDHWLHFRADDMHVVHAHVVGTDGTLTTAETLSASHFQPSAMGAVWTGARALFVVASPPGTGASAVPPVVRVVTVDADGSLLDLTALSLPSALRSTPIESLDVAWDGAHLAIAASTASTVYLFQVDPFGSFARTSEIAAANPGSVSVAWSSGAGRFGMVWRDDSQLGRPRLLRADASTDYGPTVVGAGLDVQGAPEIVSDGTSFFVTTLHPAVAPDPARALVQRVSPADGSMLGSFDVPAVDLARASVGDQGAHSSLFGEDGLLHLAFVRSPAPLRYELVHAVATTDGAVLTTDPVATGSSAAGTHVAGPLLGGGLPVWVSYGSTNLFPLGWQREITTLCP